MLKSISGPKMATEKSASLEIGKAITGLLTCDSYILGKSICDIVEFSARKIEQNRGNKSIEFNPANIFELIEKGIKYIIKKYN